MKTQRTNLFSPVTKSAMRALTTEVKETLDSSYSNRQPRTFSAAELWNIQRQRKSLSLRRGLSY